MRVYWVIPVLASILILGTIGFSQNVYAPDISGLVVHYDFEDEANPTADLSGHGNDGTLFGGATFSTDVPPIPGNTQSLDLTTDNLGDYLISSSVTAFPSDKITTTLWVKSSGTQNADPIFVSYATNTVGTVFNDWGIQNVGTTNSEFQGFVNNGVLRTGTATPDVLDGEWHHVAASWDNTNGEMKLYLDGVLVKSGTGIRTGQTIAADGTLVLGQEQDSVGNRFNANDDFNGFLDDVKIYDRVLSDEEIEELFDPIIEVDIDIKPGSDPNCFNNDGKGVIPVAILSSATFDATTVDPSTVILEGMAVKMVGKSDKLLASIEDVNGDGLNDLVVKIKDQDGTFSMGDTIATITGQTFGGDQITGTDTICITQ